MGFILDSLTGREWQNASRKCPSKWESCDQFSPFFLWSFDAYVKEDGSRNAICHSLPVRLSNIKPMEFTKT